MSAKIIFTQEEENYILNSYINLKKTTVDLGNEFKVSHKTINKLLIENGVEIRGLSHLYQWKLLESQIENIRQDIGPLNQLQLAKKYKTTPVFIRKFCKQKNIKFKNQSVKDFLIEPSILELHSRKYTQKQIAQELKVSQTKVRHTLNRHKILPWKYQDHRNYDLKEDFFEKIDSHEKAYILGFLFADGYNNEKYTVTLSIQNRDIKILECINSYIQPNKPNSIITRVARSKNRQSMSRICFDSKKISEDLKKLGCGNNKSLTCKVPNIPRKFLNSFFAGYVDGDGSIWIADKHAGCRLQVDICSSLPFWEDFEKIVTSTLNINPILSQNKNNKIFNIKIRKVDEATKFLDWIYRDTPLKLERKYQRYIDGKILRDKYNNERK